MGRGLGAIPSCEPLPFNPNFTGGGGGLGDPPQQIFAAQGKPLSFQRCRFTTFFFEVLRTFWHQDCNKIRHSVQESHDLFVTRGQPKTWVPPPHFSVAVKLKLCILHLRLQISTFRKLVQCSFNSSCFMFCFDRLIVLLSLAKNSDTWPSDLTWFYPIILCM